jgi:hypothetical protein
MIALSALGTTIEPVKTTAWKAVHYPNCSRSTHVPTDVCPKTVSSRAFVERIADRHKPEADGVDIYHVLR